MPASITINHPNAGALMLVGQTRQLSANVLPANAANRNVVWTSSNPAVATVAANGQLRAVRPGNATITARTAAGNRVATTTVRIQASPAALNSSQRNIRMRQGTTFRIPLIVRGTTNTDVTVNWRTTNRNVATLVAGRTNGTMNIRQNASRVLTIRAVRPGTARIVLTAQNGRTITYNITVQRNNQRLNRVRISNLPPRNTMNRNVTRNLSYRVT
ncbi:MAG: Ig-like domain-containing protein, partial [Coriobacteriia bacterium]|nr:Ig-like domain-containing protein [Coriobacteriia bacterium]